MVGDIVLCLDHFRALCRFLQVHVVNTVTTEEGVIYLLFSKRGHLFSRRSISGHVNRDSVCECYDISHTILQIVVLVISGFHCLQRSKSAVKGLVQSVHKSFLPGDDFTVRIPVCHFVQIIMVIVSVGHQNEVGRRFIALAGIGINVNSLSLRSGDPNAGMPHIEQFSLFVRICCTDFFFCVRFFLSGLMIAFSLLELSFPCLHSGGTPCQQKDNSSHQNCYLESHSRFHTISCSTHNPQ